MRLPFFFCALLALALAACGGGDDDDDSGDNGDSSPEATSESTGDAGASGEPVSLVVASSELILGPNRFIFGLFDAENQLVNGAEATLTLFADAQENPTEVGTFPVDYLEIEFPDPESPPDIAGVYRSNLEFDSPGVYGAQINVEGLEEVPQGLRVFLQVEEPDQTSVQVGEPAPPSDTPTSDEVDDLAQIDSDEPPNPQLHELSVADAVTSGRPTVVSFATPAFCTSRLCGPMIDVILVVQEEYGDRVNFIQIEPFELDENGEVVSQNGTFVPAETFTEWGLASEPVTFVIDQEGIVAYRFESMTTADELREALDAVLT
jgi:hypothetical protein